MKVLSEKLLHVIESAEPILRIISERESTKPILSGGWSSKQVIGHLIDSASNNHQRFVRASLQLWIFRVTSKTDGCVCRLFETPIGVC